VNSQFSWRSNKRRTKFHPTRIQLVSGTHRHEAAKKTGIRLPVKVMLRSSVEAMWGKPTWDNFIADIKVRDLELVPVKEENDVPPGLDERVDLTRDIDYLL